MKKMLLLLGSVLAITTASAQAFKKGDVQLNGGLGFSDISTMIYGGVDFGISKQVSLGGELFYRGTSKGDIEYSNIGVLFTSNFHFAQYIRVPSNLDLYGGLSLGYYHWAHTSKYRWLKPYYDSGVALRLQSGARWFFTQNFGVNAEWFLDHNSFADLGLKLGVTYKFK